MLIKNYSKCDVWLDTCTRIKSGEEYDSYENGFDRKNIHADCGSAIIVTEYCERHIRCFGSMSCREDITERDKNNMYVIIIEDKDSPIE